MNLILGVKIFKTFVIFKLLIEVFTYISLGKIYQKSKCDIKILSVRIEKFRIWYNISEAYFLTQIEKRQFFVGWLFLFPFL